MDNIAKELIPKVIGPARLSPHRTNHPPCEVIIIGARSSVVIDQSRYPTVSHWGNYMSMHRADGSHQDVKGQLFDLIREQNCGIELFSETHRKAPNATVTATYGNKSISIRLLPETVPILENKGIINRNDPGGKYKSIDPSIARTAPRRGRYIENFHLTIDGKLYGNKKTEKNTPGHVAYYGCHAPGSLKGGSNEIQASAKAQLGFNPFLRNETRPGTFSFNFNFRGKNLVITIRNEDI